MICNAELCANYFSVNVSILPVVFRRKFQVKQLGHNSALYMTSYLSTTLSKILPYLKTIKNAKKLSVFGENNPCRVSNFLQTHTFWNFDHISRIYNQINYLILIFDIFIEKDPHLNAVEWWQNWVVVRWGKLSVATHTHCQQLSLRFNLRSNQRLSLRPNMDCFEVIKHIK